MLLFGAKRLHYVESIVNPKDELELPVDYTQSMIAGALAYAAGLNDAAIIGLGGGRTAWYLHKSVPELAIHGGRTRSGSGALADVYFNVRPEHEFRHRDQGRPRLPGARPTMCSTSSSSTPIADLSFRSIC